jgi:hypothetical protein
MQYCFYLVLLLFLFGLITVFIWSYSSTCNIFWSYSSTCNIFWSCYYPPQNSPFGLVTTPLFVFGLVTVLRFWSYYDPLFLVLLRDPDFHNQ